jgi:hypothetical protein
MPLLSSGRTSAAAGMALGVSKTVAYEYLSAMRKYGFAEVAAEILEPLARRLHAALQALRQVPHDLGEPYELVYSFIRDGGKLPVLARWIEGQGAPA